MRLPSAARRADQRRITKMWNARRRMPQYRPTNDPPSPRRLLAPLSASPHSTPRPSPRAVKPPKNPIGVSAVVAPACRHGGTVCMGLAALHDARRLPASARRGSRAPSDDDEESARTTHPTDVDPSWWCSHADTPNPPPERVAGEGDVGIRVESCCTGPQLVVALR